jgi:hypothetical protein
MPVGQHGHRRSADRSLYASGRLARALQTKADDVERLLLHVACHFKPPFIPDLELILQIRDVFGSNFGSFPASCVVIGKPLPLLVDPGRLAAAVDVEEVFRHSLNISFCHQIGVISAFRTMAKARIR